MMVEKPGAV